MTNEVISKNQELYEFTSFEVLERINYFREQEYKEKIENNITLSKREKKEVIF